jgi:uncharacterized protein YsxB (DUF464 family)
MLCHYDETPIENQKLQFKYGLKTEFCRLQCKMDLSDEEQKHLDILHHGTEEQIKQLAENYNKKIDIKPIMN